MMKSNMELQTQEYKHLVEEIKATITEAVYVSRWALVEGYWNVGKLIREQFTGNDLTKQLQLVAVAAGVSERTLFYALQTYDKYPKIDTLPEGKNITWKKLITKYLPQTKTEEKREECVHKWVCTRCGQRR